MKTAIKLFLMLLYAAVMTTVAPVAVANGLWENGEVNIWADDSSLHAQLKKHAEKLARNNASCPKISWVDQSVNRPGQFYLVCSNNNKLYWTKGDMS